MMLGPMKKKMIVTGVICTLIPVILFTALFVVFATNKKKQIEALKVETAVVEKYIFSGDLPVNHIITTADVRVAGVKGISAPIDSYSAGDLTLIGRELKIPVMDGTIATEAMFYTEEDKIDKDIRIKEYNMISLPSDLQKGDYIDIRITFPNGENYLVVAGQEVMDVGSTTDTNTIFLDVSEENLLRLEGAILETYISDSVNLYAVKYRNPDMQLFREEEINYVKLYEDTVDKIIEERTIYEDVEVPNTDNSNDESGESSGEGVMTPSNNETTKIERRVKYRPTREELDEEVAALIDLEVEEVATIRNALKENDENIIRIYSNKVKRIRTALVANYPVREEVARVINSNPNVVDEIRRKYNVEELINERENLISTSIYKIDENTGELVEDDAVLSSVASNLATQIQTQKDERKTYLQSLVRSAITSQMTAQ